VHGGLRERDAHVLGLRAVDQVAEDPAHPAERLAVGRLVVPAVGALPAVGDGGDDDPVPGPETGHGVADLGDRADRLVAQDPAVRDGRDVALEDVQVGAADGGRVDLRDDVGGVPQDRVGDVLPDLVAGSVIDERLHGEPPRSADWRAARPLVLIVGRGLPAGTGSLV
jgi:hypothetical protein